MGEELGEAIERARKLELDGIEFYTDAAQKCSVLPGKRMFESFAADERRHLKIIEDVAKGLGVDVDQLPMPRDEIRTLFSEATETLDDDVRASAQERDAVRIALDMEAKSFQLYKEAAAEATEETPRKLFERLAREENQHYEMLENTLEYLSSNKEWFMWNEWALIVGDQSSLGQG